MTVLLFGDGSPTIGAGHHVRLAALAHALAAQGERVVPACRDLAGSTHRWAWAGLTPIVLDRALSLVDAIDRAVDQARPEIVVIDHYDADGALLAALAARVPLVLFDDVPGRDLRAASLVINPALAASAADYPDVPVVTGASWAPLRPQFRERGLPRGDAALVALGSGDVLGLLPRLVAAVTARTALAIDVVTTAEASSPALERLVDARRVRWHRGVDAETMARLMASCRVAIVSASQVALEAAACGAPLVVMRTVDNQVRLAKGLADTGVTVLELAQIDEVPEVLAIAAQAPAWRLDGGGAGRVASRVRELAVAVDPRLRPACWADGDALLEWANDPATRAASFREPAISRDEHRAWLARQLNDPEARLFIAEDGSGPLGTVRLRREGDAATVSIAVARERRGRGAGRRLLAALADWTERAGFARRLDAWVRDDNPASLALFAAAGYDLVGAEAVSGQPARRFRRQVA